MVLEHPANLALIEFTNFKCIVYDIRAEWLLYISSRYSLVIGLRQGLARVMGRARNIFYVIRIIYELGWVYFLN